MDPGGPGERVTIEAVAARAGVSKTTVSHVLSGNRPVAPETRARVESAVAEMAYRPDGLARSLRTRRSHMVALIIPDITNPFYPVLARGLEDCLVPSGYLPFICSTDAKPDLERDFVADVVSRRVDGIVMVSFHPEEARMSRVIESGMPVVSVGGGVLDDPRIDVVQADDERGAFDAVTHLLRRGHRCIAMIEGAPGSGLSRNAGYAHALEAAGIAPDAAVAVPGHWTREGGRGAMRRLLAARPRPTAVFCANDLMALGAIDEIAAAGLEVGGEVAIVGYDDIEAAGLLASGLTTVSNPAYETGREAGRLLLERMTGSYEGPQRRVVVPCTLVERGSA
jgi:LacI family transcriptional regulator